MPPKNAPSNLFEMATPLKHTAALHHPHRNYARPVEKHRFKVGQTVWFSPNVFEPAARQGSYRVVGHLPADGNDNQYRLKSLADGHERVARESQLAVK